MSSEFLWRRMLEISLSPILIAQALHVRRRVEKLPEPAGERSGCVGSGTVVRVLILGDSAAAGVGVDEQEHALSGQLVRALAADHCVHWRLCAYTGATTTSTLRDLMADASDRDTFDYCVVSLGVNDATSGINPTRWLGMLQRLQDQLLHQFGIRHAWYAALPPMHLFPALPQPMRSLLGGRARALDQALIRWCEGASDRSRLALDAPIEPAHMARDGFHPGPPVYERWGRIAAECIREKMQYKDLERQKMQHKDT